MTAVHPPFATVGLCLMVSLVAPLPAQRPTPQPPKDSAANVIDLELDPIAGVVRTASPDDAARIRQIDSRTFRLKGKAQIALHVINVNTGLDTVILADSAAPVVGRTNASDVGSIIGAYKTFFPQIAAALSTAKSRGSNSVSLIPPIPPSADPNGPIGRAITLAKRMEPDVYQADTLAGRRPEELHDAIVAAVPRLRAERPESVAADFRRRFHVQGGDCTVADQTPLRFVSRLAALRATIRPRSDSLQELLETPVLDTARSIRDTLTWFRGHTDSILRRADTVTQNAKHVESAAVAIAAACSSRRMDARPIDESAGRVFYVHVQPRPEPELSDAGDSRSVTVKILAPRRFFVPSLGLSALVAPHARFDNYSTRNPATPAQGQVEIYTTKPVDARYSWGVTVGGSWRPLDWREQNGIALWIPELTVQQPVSGGSGLGAGVGTALSYNVIKLGVGLLWAQHPVLNGQHVGQLIPNSAFLSTRDGFGNGRLYVSLSVFDVQSLLTGK